MEINNTNSSMASDASNAHAFGAQLKRARLDKNLSLKDVSDELYILQRHLQALEEENFTELPQAAFTRGFVINYAKFLGLDPHRIVSGFDSAYPQQLRGKSIQDIESPLQPMGTLQREGGRSWKINPLLVIGIILLIAFGIFLMRVVGNAQERNAIEAQNATLGDETSVSDQVAGAYIAPNNTNSPSSDSSVYNNTGSAFAGATEQGSNGSAIGATDLNTNESESGASDQNIETSQPTVNTPINAPSNTTINTTTNTLNSTPPRVANIPLPAGQNAVLELWVQQDTTVNVVDASGNILINGLKSRGGYEVKGLPPFKVQIDNVDRVSLDLNQQKVRLNDYAQNNQANFTLGSTS